MITLTITITKRDFALQKQVSLLDMGNPADEEFDKERSEFKKSSDSLHMNRSFSRWDSTCAQVGGSPTSTVKKIDSPCRSPRRSFDSGYSKSSMRESMKATLKERIKIPSFDDLFDSKCLAEKIMTSSSTSGRSIVSIASSVESRRRF